jgi:hypothetical protein
MNRLASFFGIDKIIRHHVMSTYIRFLPVALKKTCGMQSRYSVKEVLGAILVAELSRSNIKYGLAMYCTCSEFDNFFESRADKPDYFALRTAIAHQYFNGNVAFTAEDIDTVSEREK